MVKKTAILNRMSINRSTKQSGDKGQRTGKGNSKVRGTSKSNGNGKSNSKGRRTSNGKGRRTGTSKGRRTRKGKGRRTRNKRTLGKGLKNRRQFGGANAKDEAEAEARELIGGTLVYLDDDLDEMCVDDLYSQFPESKHTDITDLIENYDFEGDDKTPIENLRTNSAVIESLLLEERQELRRVVSFPHYVTVLGDDVRKIKEISNTEQPLSRTNVNKKIEVLRLYELHMRNDISFRDNIDNFYGACNDFMNNVNTNDNDTAATKAAATKAAAAREHILDTFGELIKIYGHNQIVLDEMLKFLCEFIIEDVTGNPYSVDTQQESSKEKIDYLRENPGVWPKPAKKVAVVKFGSPGGAWECTSPVILNGKKLNNGNQNNCGLKFASDAQRKNHQILSHTPPEEWVDCKYTTHDKNESKRVTCEWWCENEISLITHMKSHEPDKWESWHFNKIMEGELKVLHTKFWDTQDKAEAKYHAGIEGEWEKRSSLWCKNQTKEVTRMANAAVANAAYRGELGIPMSARTKMALKENEMALKKNAVEALAIRLFSINKKDYPTIKIALKAAAAEEQKKEQKKRQNEILNNQELQKRQEQTKTGILKKQELQERQEKTKTTLRQKISKLGNFSFIRKTKEPGDKGENAGKKQCLHRDNGHQCTALVGPLDTECSKGHDLLPIPKSDGSVGYTDNDNDPWTKEPSEYKIYQGPKK
jgi:hypothetical protein